MAQLIGILVVVALVALLVAFVVGILAYIVAIVAIPSIAVMELIQFLGLTDPGWYVVLHALLGAAVGLWAHRVNRTHRFIAISILVLLVLIFSC